MGIIIFSFRLHAEQADIVWTLLYKFKDLLLFAKTGLGKSLIFQLLSFMSMSPSVVIILMLLKLFQRKHNAMIN